MVYCRRFILILVAAEEDFRCMERVEPFKASCHWQFVMQIANAVGWLLAISIINHAITVETYPEQSKLACMFNEIPSLVHNLKWMNDLV